MTKLLGGLIVWALIGCSHALVQRNLEIFPPASKTQWKNFSPPVRPYNNAKGEVCMNPAHFLAFVQSDIKTRGQLKKCNAQSAIFNAAGN